MPTESARKWILGAWLAIAAMATIRWVQPQATPAPGVPGIQSSTAQQEAATGAVKSGWPPPSLYFASGVLFSLYWLAAGWERTAKFFVVLAVGTDIAAILLPYINNQGSFGPGDTPIDRLTQLLAGIAGSGAQPLPNTPPGVQPGQGPSSFAPFGVTPPQPVAPGFGPGSGPGFP